MAFYLSSKTPCTEGGRKPYKATITPKTTQNTAEFRFNLAKGYYHAN
jgi:hypothetical protein